MKKTNNKNLLIVIFVIQLAFILIMFGFALWGRFEHNQSSNIWSLLWLDAHLGALHILYNPIALIIGIYGLVKSADRTERILSVLLIISFLVGCYSFMYAIGSKF
jgi:uncharacterized membrane protein